MSLYANDTLDEAVNQPRNLGPVQPGAPSQIDGSFDVFNVNPSGPRHLPSGEAQQNKQRIPGTGQVGKQNTGDGDATNAQLPTKIVEIYGTPYTLNEYFGDHWVRTNILAHHNQPPIQKPNSFAVTPHPWQLRGAAQLHYMCKSYFKGGICADAPGLGKTLTAILLMELAKTEPGSFSLVVCPASRRRKWESEILSTYRRGFEPKVLVLDDYLTTDQQLFQENYDIVIVSYNFLNINYQEKMAYLEDFRKYQLSLGPAPRQPITALFTEFWRYHNLPIKRLILDECHQFKNDNSPWRLAAKSLFRRATVMLSSKILNYAWHDIAAPVTLLRGHPLTTKEKFLHAFASKNKGILTNRNMVWLQRFLLAVLIARPSCVLAAPSLASKLENKESSDASSPETKKQKNARLVGPLVRKDDDPLVIPAVVD